MVTNSTRNLDESMNDDALFVLEDNSSIYGLNSSTTAGGRRGSNGNSAQVGALSLVRPSSIVMLRQNEQDGDRGVDGGDEKPSWWENPNSAHSRTCLETVQVVIHGLVLAALPVAMLLAAYHTDNQVLPFVYSVFVAFASYEFAWVAYRVRVHVFLPFKLHQKQTCRDIYRQIMSYSVDLQTCAVTPFAERVLCGRKVVAACLLGLLSGSVALSVCLILRVGSFPLAYIVMSMFLAVFCAALSPNLPDAVAMLLRYVYFFVASINVVLTLQKAKRADIVVVAVEPPPLTVEPFSLALIAVSSLLINRVLTSKETMESAVQMLLDIAGLLYLSCAAMVLNYFVQSPLVVVEAADSEAKKRSSCTLLAFFVIVWSAEMGSFLMERFLKFIDFPWNHPIAKRVSSRQNVETLVGALVGGVCATFVVADYVEFHMETSLVACLSAGAIVLSHVAKLFLLSLKKLAKIPRSGAYLAIGGGILDHMDTILFMAIVFGPFFERQLGA